MSEWGESHPRGSSKPTTDTSPTHTNEGSTQPSSVEETEESTSGEITLSTQYLVPTIQRIGNRDIETTFLGDNAFDEPTWVLWTAEEPYLIGILRQGQLGYTFEQRTSQGVMLHKDISFRKVQAALTVGR